MASVRPLAWLSLLLCAISCGSADPPPPSPGALYLSEPSFRRAELQASLVNPNNTYSLLRLAHYAGGDFEWDALPEWNPRVDPVVTTEVDEGTAADAPLSPAAVALSTTASVDDDAAILALGKAAFFAYPVELVPAASVAVASREAASAYGLWIDADRAQVGGLVRAELADGSTELAFTCATCHADEGATGLITGAGSSTLDFGRILANGGASAIDATLLAWGRGRVDVTTADGSAPERIPDLRPARWLTHLHQEATIAQHDLTTLAIRIETLIITSHGTTLRPPRLIAWAIAAYVWSLADALPSSEPTTESTLRGASLFSTNCSSCHTQPGLTGPPIALDVVGTDPAIGLSADRGTGMYRVPSLHGVGSRGLLLHDASLPSLDALFDPTRTLPTFAGGTRGTGAVPGHLYGLDLADADRADLVAYLKTL